MTYFFAPGKPQPKGSTRIVPNRRTGRAMTTSDNPRLKDWQGIVSLAAKSAGCKPIAGPVRVDLVFRLGRPLKHLCSRGLTKSAPAEHSTKPDIDKLARGVLDALTGVAIADDSQVSELYARKEYAKAGSTIGVHVAIALLEVKP